MGDSTFKRYWKAYGGWKAIAESKYFWASITITGILYPMWTKDGWWDLVLNIMPNLLGFSLGGYAMWLSVGDDKFRKLVVGSEDGEDGHSPYLEVCATFAHFIILQILAIVLSVAVKAYESVPDASKYYRKELIELIEYISPGVMGVCFFIFIYALASTLAATLALFKISTWYDDMITNEKRKNVRKKK